MESILSLPWRGRSTDSSSLVCSGEAESKNIAPDASNQVNLPLGGSGGMFLSWILPLAKPGTRSMIDGQEYNTRQQDHPRLNQSCHACETLESRPTMEPSPAEANLGLQGTNDMNLRQLTGSRTNSCLLIKQHYSGWLFHFVRHLACYTVN